ncbi:MAG: class I SAM-dependent methyltransferase [Deltaproteobacteria bacterium]|jgi:SAM-dependent methyltransferase|nr:class I SAM-dependent methyltransferase [Deltaproteobacteria bacterium]
MRHPVCRPNVKHNNIKIKAENYMSMHERITHRLMWTSERIQRRLMRISERIDDCMRYIADPRECVYKFNALKQSEKIMRRPELQSACALAERIKEQDSDSERQIKYTNVRRYIVSNLRRLYSLGLHGRFAAPSPRKPFTVLDIGAGAGFFLYCCKLYGHEGTGFDASTSDLYTGMHAALGVRCACTAIRPMTPLPDFGGKFDLITAFAVCFHIAGGRVWSADEWRFFLCDLLQNHCADGGKIYLHLNDNPPGDRADVRKKILASFPSASFAYQAITLCKK